MIHNFKIFLVLCLINTMFQHQFFLPRYSIYFHCGSFHLVPPPIPQTHLTTMLNSVLYTSLRFYCFLTICYSPSMVLNIPPIKDCSVSVSLHLTDSTNTLQFHGGSI